MTSQQQQAGKQGGTSGRGQGASGKSQGRGSERQFGAGLLRAFGGAIIFALPLMMTMEMWWLGFYMDRARLVLLLLVTYPVLLGLSRFAGFEPTFGWIRDSVDALVAYAVGFVAPAVILFFFDVLELKGPVGILIGKASLQAVPASIGALLARSQLSGQSRHQKQEKQRAGYAGQLFLMGVGALFLALNVAPTQEMLLIAMKMSEWQAIGLALLSMAIMHVFVYGSGFRQHASGDPKAAFWSLLLRYTVTGYAVVLLGSLYVLWTFGRTEGMAAVHIVTMMIVLGFPAAIGAAAARLILGG